MGLFLVHLYGRRVSEVDATQKLDRALSDIGVVSATNGWYSVATVG
jgi:hypothetical protein